jgi:ferric-dicitrate binding protein FerR (iron transport regulator)
MHCTDHIIALLNSYLKGEIHPDTHEELRLLFEHYPELHVMVMELGNPENLERELENYENLFGVNATKAEQRVLSTILNRIESPPADQQMSWFRKYRLFVAAAACIIGLIGLGTWKLKQAEQPQAAVDPILLAKDLVPGANKATLQLADGTNVELDGHHSGILMGNKIRYSDGSVLLNTPEDQGKMMLLSTPRGGQYQIALSDGTKVWLNAETRLRYPNKFTGQTRVVELDGEAYFEVEKMRGKPFIVVTNKEKVEVLGTHFNVYSFPAEQQSKVSLLEGKVKVSVPVGKERVLVPGEQAVVHGDDLSVQQAVVEESVAWKNNEFMFNNEPLGTALTQIARWYDIDIDIAPSVAKIRLWGSVSRMDNFDKVLKIIKMTDDKIKVQIEGRRVKLMK